MMFLLWAGQPASQGIATEIEHHAGLVLRGRIRVSGKV